jgi:hypothetical protein
LFQRRCAHRLDTLELVSAFLTGVLVSRHGNSDTPTRPREGWPESIPAQHRLSILRFDRGPSGSAP